MVNGLQWFAVNSCSSYAEAWLKQRTLRRTVKLKWKLWNGILKWICKVLNFLYKNYAIVCFLNYFDKQINFNSEISIKSRSLLLPPLCIINASSLQLFAKNKKGFQSPNLKSVFVLERFFAQCTLLYTK